jgi:Flp pilus assembly protein TadD
VTTLPASTAKKRPKLRKSVPAKPRISAKPRAAPRPTTDRTRVTVRRKTLDRLTTPVRRTIPAPLIIRDRPITPVRLTTQVDPTTPVDLTTRVRPTILADLTTRVRPTIPADLTPRDRPTILADLTTRASPNVRIARIARTVLISLSGLSVRSARSRINDRAVRAALAALLLLLLPVTLRAYSPEATQAFETGKQAFAAQDYAAALDAFEAAAAAGMTGPVVQFNVGVCAYRIGDWSRATAAFREAARTSGMAPLAHYNLGLVAVAEHKEEQAAKWFALAQREARDERLQALATEQLARLARPAERNWYAYGSLAAGYDDNVALVSGGDVLGVSDTEDAFAELQLAFAAPLTGRWRFDGGLVMLDYQDLDGFDQLSVNAGARYRLPVGNWSNEAAVQFAYSTLDGAGFQNKAMLILQGTRALSDEWRLRVRYRFSDINGLDGFEGLDGTRHELGVRGTWRRGQWDINVQYRYDTTDYQEERLSFDRHQILLDAQRDFGENWSVETVLSFDRSSYDTADNSAEDRAEIELAVSRSFGRRWRAIMRYAYADNRAELPEFDYQRNRISAGVEANW